MEVKTYRAKSMREALRLVRDDLGPDASVLQTREVRGGALRWMFGPKQIEVTASADVQVPSRFAEPISTRTSREDSLETGRLSRRLSSNDDTPIQSHRDVNGIHDNGEQSPLRWKESAAGQRESTERPTSHDLPASLIEVFSELMDADVSEELTRELIERLRAGIANGNLDDQMLLRARLLRMIEEEVVTSGPIRIDSSRTRLVALVGPTGVGKTTTIAKLAANFHLREQLRIGLITVDTYRIAAVDQLRTYADIINLPMEVVSSRREMRRSLDRLAGLDLILMDTAGRSPHDVEQIQELKALLCEANPDEIHLVVSSVASMTNLQRTAQRFADVGATALVLTKLDEATGLGPLLPLLRSCRLPLSYLTNGQNVPVDIDVADSRRIARAILGMPRNV